MAKTSTKKTPSKPKKVTAGKSKKPSAKLDKAVKSNAGVIVIPRRAHRVHPFKSPLKKMGLRNWQIAEICDVSYGYMSHILNGIVPMPERVHDRLVELFRQQGVEF